MFKSIAENIQNLEKAVKEGTSCHDLPPGTADIEMLQILEKEGCIDRQNCRHSACPAREAVLNDCLGRWRQRESGMLTESDRILVAYYLMKQFM